MAIGTLQSPVERRSTTFLTAADRSRAFRVARRHSVAVRLLRVLLPVAALGVVSLYVLPGGLSVTVGDSKVSIDAVNIANGDLKMVNPRIKGVHPRHGVYDVVAESATQHVSEPDLVTLNTVTGEVVSPAGETTTLAAPSGIFHTKKEELTFDNGVTIGGSSGLAATLRTATVDLQQNSITSNEPVELHQHDSIIRAQAMVLYTSENRAVFTGRVFVHLERQQKATDR